MRRTLPPKIRDAAILSAMAAGLIAIIRPAIVAAQSTVNSQLCIQNVQQFSTVVLEYTQDYDETIPPLVTSVQLVQRLQPYTSTADVAYLLTCPLTQLPYTLNTSIGGKSLPSLPGGASATTLLQDSIPHTDGKSTIGYVDGTYTYGGVVPFTPDTTCLNNAKQVGVALLEYTQDYDEVLPVYHSYSDFETVLQPYAKSTRIFQCPDTSLPYAVNKSFSQASFFTIAAPAKTVFLKDARPHPDGKITSAFLDGHAAQLGQ